MENLDENKKEEIREHLIKECKRRRTRHIIHFCIESLLSVFVGYTIVRNFLTISTFPSTEMFHHIREVLIFSLLVSNSTLAGVLIVKFTKSIQHIKNAEIDEHYANMYEGEGKEYVCKVEDKE